MKLSPDLPSRVPLPEVSQHTDKIEIGGLGLPQGFDEARLLVNLRGLELARRAAGVGKLSIATYEGSAESMSVGVSSMSAQGEATSSGNARRPRSRLAKGSVSYPEARFSHFGQPEAAIRINRAGVNERIQEGNYKQGLFDPKAQATHLNTSLTEGLHQAGFRANVDSSKSLMAVAHSTITGGVSLIAPSPEMLGAGAAAYLFGHALFAVLSVNEYATEHRTTLRKGFSEYRFGLLAGATLDRCIGLRAVTATHKFIKAAA